MESFAQASSRERCVAGRMRAWCSCWLHRSSVGATRRATSFALAMCPLIDARERPSILTRRQTTASPSSSSIPSGMSAALSKKRRPSTDRPSESSRTAVLSARSPTRSLHAERSAVFPAPVSPVIAVSPREGEKDASRMSATLLTWISSIIASPFPELAPYRASR